MINIITTIKPLFFEKIKMMQSNKNSIYQWRRKYIQKIRWGCPTLTANIGTGGHNVPIIKDNKGIRKINSQSVLNFQVFLNFKFPNLADGQLYKQAGNSVVVEVIKKVQNQ